MARGAWDRTAALMYVAACSSLGGPKRGLSPDQLNPYRAARRASLEDWFGGLRAMKAERDQRQGGRQPETNGVPDGG